MTLTSHFIFLPLGLRRIAYSALEHRPNRRVESEHKVEYLSMPLRQLLSSELLTTILASISGIKGSISN